MTQPPGVGAPPAALSSPRPLLAGAAVVVLASAATLLPPPAFDALDWLQLHQPNRLYLADALTHGRLPQWNPHIGLGRPFAADIETATFYPPSVLLVGFDPAVALYLLVVAHVALGLFGMLALGRALGLARWAAWLASASFLWSAPIVARLSAGQLPYALATCYLPLLFALAVRVHDRPSRRSVAALAAALAMQLLCGHPQIAWITWLGLAAFVLGRSLPPGAAASRPAVRGALGLGFALTAALALAGPTLLPFLELVAQGNRSAPSLSFSGGGSMEWWQWTSLLWPDGGRKVFYWEQNLYGGLLPAVVGGAGILWWRNRDLRGLLATGLAGAIVAAGSHTPLFSLLYHLVPGVSAFRLHSRAGALVVFALIVSGAFVLSRARPSRWTLALLALGATLTALGPLLYLATAPAAPDVPTFVLVARPLLALSAALAAVASIVVRPGPRQVAARAILAAIVIGELGWSIGPARRAWAQHTDREGEAPLFELLLSRHLYPPSGVPPRVVVPPWVVRENAAMIYGWAHVAGYNALTLDRVWTYLHGTLGIEPSVVDNTYPSKDIYDAGPFPYDSTSLVVGWQQGRGFVVRPEPDPRAYFVTAARRVSGWRDAVAAMAEGHPFHRVALVERDTILPGEPSASGGRATIVSFAPERVEVRTDSRVAGLLVLAEAWYPGWRATVDGSDVACFPANAWMRAVPVPAGTHTVELRFRSRWLLPGALLALVTGALLAWGALAEGKAGGSEAPPPPPNTAQA